MLFCCGFLFVCRIWLGTTILRFQRHVLTIQYQNIAAPVFRILHLANMLISSAKSIQNSCDGPIIGWPTSAKKYLHCHCNIVICLCNKDMLFLQKILSSTLKLYFVTCKQKNTSNPLCLPDLKIWTSMYKLFCEWSGQSFERSPTYSDVFTC